MSYIYFEEIRRRTPNAKTYRMSDGSLQSEIHFGPIHFKGDGDILHNIVPELVDEADFDTLDEKKPISREAKESMKEQALRLVAEKSGGRSLNRDNYDYEGLQLPYFAKIGKNFKRGYTIGKGKERLSFIPQKVSPAKGYIDEQDKSKIQYQDPWNDVDVFLQLTNEGIKETIVLKTDKAPSKFTFEVQGNLKAFNLKPAWLVDANGEYRDVGQVVYEDKTKKYIDLIADVSGLTFPVVIDPTVTIQPDGTAGKDAFVYSSAPDTNNATSTYLRAGTHSTATSYIYRSFLEFDLSSIPTMSYISSALVSLYFYIEQSTTDRNVSLHRVTAAWSENTITWNNQPAYDTTAIDSENISTLNTWYSWDVASVISNIINGTSENNGFALVGVETTTGTYKSFYSSDETTAANRPKLTITYNEVPSTPTLTIPNGGETWNAEHTITWSAATDTAGDNQTPQANLQYNIQLSTDGGSTYPTTIVALTAAGATSYAYDFSAIPQTSTAKVRIRAYDGYSYGDWDESDGVFTIQHNQAPTAPTNLSPNGVPQDRASIIRLNWQYNDPDNDQQSKFDLQYSIDGGTNWTTVTQTTTNQYYDVTANTFTRGNVVWKVRTYDQADLSSAYSTQATFYAGDKPSVPTITAPGATVVIANPTIQWSSSGQTVYQARVREIGVTVWDSGEKASTNKAQTVGLALDNNTEYTAEVRIKNADGLWSDWAVVTFTTNYTEPAIPIFILTGSTGYILLEITNPAPQGTEPSIIGNDIYRKESSETTWTRVKTGVGISGIYKDYAVSSGTTYQYKVRAWGDNGTFRDSVTGTSSVTLRGVWLHDVTDPQGTVYNFMYDGTKRDEKWKSDVAMMQFAGRDRPVSEFGEMEEGEINVTLQILKTTSDMATLRALVERKATLCYRDGRGRKLFGIIPSLPFSDVVYGNTVNIQFIETDYSEVV